MKNILEIIGKLYIGGAEKVARDIGLYEPAGYQVDYVVFGDEIGAYEAELLEKGCRIYHLASPGEGYRAYVKALRKLIQKNKYDVIHAHTMFSSGWAMWVGKKLGVPVRISHSHSIRGFEKRNWVKNTYENTMRKIILRYATHLVSCGEKAGAWLFGEKAFADRGITVLNGIETGKFAYCEAARAEIREKLNLQERFVVGHVGHLAAVKNQAFLLDILPEIQNRIPNAVLLLLGEGNDRAMLEEKIRAMGLEKCVIMTGNVPDVYRYLSAMDVFAFPSLYEGMPLSIVEVQANGLPCVISDQVPKDVFLTDLIYPVSLQDKAAWVRNICKVCREKPEQYAQIMAKTGFDTRAMVEKIYKLYEV